MKDRYCARTMPLRDMVALSHSKTTEWLVLYLGLASGVSPGSRK